MTELMVLLDSLPQLIRIAGKIGQVIQKINMGEGMDKIEDGIDKVLGAKDAKTTMDGLSQLVDCIRSLK